jgi:hypothetical protein
MAGRRSNARSKSRAGFDPRQAIRDGVLDRLVVASLEVKELVLAATAPIAAIDRIAADQIERRANVPSVLFRHHQDDAPGERAAKPIEEIARQVRITPFTVARRSVEAEE